MSSETRTCQNCKSEFVIEPEDFLFYEKIKVPPPTWCPECRLQRRLAWRNERNLYKRVCDLCKKPIISMYSDRVPFPVYCSGCWWGDGWDPREYGTEYDVTKPFFEQFHELMSKVPQEALQGKQSVNSDYSNYTMNAKDAYLSVLIVESENVSFSRFLLQCRDCSGCSMSTKLEKCVRMSRTGFCSDSSDCMITEYSHGVHFMYDCINCSDCYGCINLNHKRYHIFNRPYSKEEYEKKVAQLKSFPWEEQRERVHAFFRTQPVRGYIHYFSHNVSGEEIYYSENCKQCFLANFVKDSAYIFNTSSLDRSNEATHDNYDCTIVADTALCYEMIGGSKSYQCRFGFINDNSISLDYSMFCYGSSNLFGCIGLRNKQRCILNREYDAEVYAELRMKIVQEMGDYGEFPPAVFSPFAYNETLAQEYFPLTKSEALRKGYAWKDPEARDYKITMRGNTLPDRIADVRDSVLQETIGCAHEEECSEQCTFAFKIIPQELALYRRLELPLPRLCPNCRYSQILNERNPLKLFEARCRCAGAVSENGAYANQADHGHGKVHCLNSFKTVFKPEEMIVYCKECYQSEFI